MDVGVYKSGAWRTPSNPEGRVDLGGAYPVMAKFEFFGYLLKVRADRIKWCSPCLRSPKPCFVGICFGIDCRPISGLEGHPCTLTLPGPFSSHRPRPCVGVKQTSYESRLALCITTETKNTIAQVTAHTCEADIMIEYASN